MKQSKHYNEVILNKKYKNYDIVIEYARSIVEGRKVACREVVQMCQRFLVSIPYRYATNKTSRQSPHITLFKFQFLIGTLQTETTREKLQDQPEFQFLIGTLQTPYSVGGGS